MISSSGISRSSWLSFSAASLAFSSWILLTSFSRAFRVTSLIFTPVSSSSFFSSLGILTVMDAILSCMYNYCLT